MTRTYVKKVLANRQTGLYCLRRSTEQPLLNLTGSEFMEYAAAEAYDTNADRCRRPGFGCPIFQ